MVVLKFMRKSSSYQNHCLRVFCIKYEGQDIIKPAKYLEITISPVNGVILALLYLEMCFCFYLMKHKSE